MCQVIPELRLGSADLLIFLLQSFQQFNRGADLGLLPGRLLRNLPFNRERSLITNFLECLHECAHIDVTFAERRLAAPGFPRSVRPGCVLAMDAADSRAE